MKILKGLLLCQLTTASPQTTTSSPLVSTSESTSKTTCDAGELTLPKNGKRWICDSDNNVVIPSKRKCVLECNDGYEVEACEFKGRNSQKKVHPRLLKMNYIQCFNVIFIGVKMANGFNHIESC